MSAARDTLRAVGDLVAAGLVRAADAAALAPVAARYAVAIPPALAGLIELADADDPIARQLVPDARELVTTPAERADPIGDGAMSPLPGIVHRYPDRVLLKITGVCPLYCRFCFRREMIGPEKGMNLDAAALDAAIAYVAARPAIGEVILTGGDPLILSPRRIREVTTRLSAIPHVSVLRWHSRVPVATPERIDAGMVAALTATRCAVYVGVHVNHARELGGGARTAIGRLADAGIALLSQTVLLAGVNDAPGVLADLLRALVALRVKPYYLHHPDLAPGTGHFRLPIAKGQETVRGLRGRISGLAQPAYVLDLPGGAGKVAIGLDQQPVSRGPAGNVWRFTDWRGIVHDYVEAS